MAQLQPQIRPCSRAHHHHQASYHNIQPSVSATVKRRRSTWMCRDSSSDRSNSASDPGPQSQSSSARLAAAAAAAAVLVAAAPATYRQLSSSASALPPLPLVLEGAAGAVVGAFVLAKLRYGDSMHLELHKGRLYLQLGVPSSGPPLQPPDSVVTRPTGDVRGNGAYATRVIPAGTHLADYTGEVLSNQQFFSRYPDGVGDYVMAIDQDKVIDAAAWVAATDSWHPVHMNHSRTRHNVVRYYQRSQGRVAFFASRDIQPGEELLFDYGRSYWRGREHLELP